MPLTVKETFEQYSELGPDDKNLPSRIISFERAFINKNSNHTEFFGGNLIGTPPIRWTDRDTKQWLEEVLLIDDIRGCQRDLYECDDIEKDYNVSSDVFNLSIPWVLNILWRQSSNLKDRPELISALVVGMSFHLSTFMFRRFPNPTNPIIAQSTFEKLSNKFDFKKEGSWINLLRARTDIFLNTEGRYPDVWQEMTNDARTVRMCNEVNGNIRGTVNLLTSNYYTELASSNRMKIASKVGELEGEKVIKDYIRKYDTFRADIASMCSSPSTLIKKDVIEVTYNLSPAADEDMGVNTLNYLSDNYNSRDGWNDIPERLGKLLLDIGRTRKVDFNSIGDVVGHVRALLRSSNTRVEDIHVVKKSLMDLSKKANVGERDNRHISNVVAVATYLVIRILAINYYK